MLNKIFTNLCIAPLITSDDITNGVVNLYVSYETKYSNVNHYYSGRPHTESYPSSSRSGGGSSFSQQYCIDDIGSECELQIENYPSSFINEPNIYFEARYQFSRDVNFYILDWWKKHSTTYPILSIMTRVSNLKHMLCVV